MAKLTYPLHSNSAHGSIGLTINFRTGKQGANARLHKSPSQPRPSHILVRRQKFKDGAAGWHLLTENQKNTYELNAKLLNISAYNLYQSFSLRDMLPAEGTQWDDALTLWDGGSTYWDL